MSFVSKLDLEARQRWAAENILNSEALTDELADPEAARLLAWATDRAKAAARETAAQPPAEAEATLEARLTALRKLVRGINKLAGEGQPADPARVRRRLSHLAETAEMLDLASPDEESAAAYVQAHGSLEASARLEELLRLLGEKSQGAGAPGPLEEST